MGEGEIGRWDREVGREWWRGGGGEGIQGGEGTSVLWYPSTMTLLHMNAHIYEQRDCFVQKFIFH